MIRLYEKRIMKFGLLIFFGLLFFSFLSSDAFAATKYWVGTANGTTTNSSGNWSLTANSACGTNGGAGAPAAADVLIFTSYCNNNANIDAGLTVTTFTMGVTGNVYTGTVTQSSGISATTTGAFSIAGGTFVGGDSTLRFATYTQTGGTFTSTTGDLVLTLGNAVSFAHTVAGTFNHNNGTVRIISGNNTVNATGEEFYNFITSNTANFPVTITGTINVNGTLAVANIQTGTINAKGSSVTVGCVVLSGCTGIVVASSTQAQTVTVNNIYMGTLTVNNSQATVSMTNTATTTFAALNLSNFSGSFDTNNYPLIVTGAFSMGTGTFEGRTKSVNLGTLSLSGGTFNSTTGTLTLSNGNVGSFAKTGSGVFNNMGGTVLFAGGHTTLNASGQVFNNLTLAVGVSGNFTIVGAITVNGTLLFTTGKIYTGSITANGPVTFGYANTTNFGDGTVNIVGTSTQSVIFGGGNGFIPYLNINNSQATIYYNGTTTFSNLTLTNFSGNFDIGDYPMTVYPSNYIFTLAGGNFIQGSKTLDVQRLVISGGTFNGGTGAINISGYFIINSGTFNSTSGTLTISGNGTYFYHLGGTFNANNGEFRFTGFSQSCRCSGTIFNDLTLYQSSVSTSMVVYGPTGSTPATSTVAGDFVLTRGSISAGVIDITGPTATFASGSSNAAYTGTVRFSGSDVQTITIAGGGTSYYPKMVINNPLAEISYNGVSNINSLSIQNGTFSLGGNNITVPSGLTVGPNGNFKRYGSETITTSIPSFSVGATATYNGTAASYNLPTYAHTNANVVIDAPSSDTVYNMTTSATTTNLTIASGVLNNGGAHALVTTNLLTVAAAGSWTATSTGAITIGTGGVSNEGYVSLISPSSMLIRSTVSNSQRPWVGSGYFGMTGLNVKDQGGTAPITVYSGTNSGNNDVNWTFSGVASPDRVWKGQTSSVWSTASNWTPSSVPGSTGNAIFSPTYKNPATFDAGATNPANVIINSGYTSTVTLAKDMSLSAFTQGAGTFNASSYNLTTSGNLTQTAGTFSGGSGIIDIGGNLTVSGGTFVPSSATTSVYGNFNSTGGTISATSGTMVFDGASQTITGTTTFNNINKVVSSATNLIFGAGQTFTVLGTTTLQGVSGQQLTIKSSSTPSQWMFDPRGGLDLAYVTVKDSNNISSSTTGLYPTISANNYVGITDGTNNTNWTFTLPIITISATGTQATSTGLPTFSKYMGGVFEIVSNVGTNNVTSIALTQVGTLSTSQISSVSLYYKASVAGVCQSDNTFPTGVTLFGTGTVWSSNKVTLSGTLAVGNTPVCLYTLFNLSGNLTMSNIFQNVDLRIVAPSTDIISGVTISPATEIDILGVTTVIGGGSGLPTISLSVASSTVSTVSGSTTLSWSTGYNPHTCTASGDNGVGGEWTSGSSKNTDSGTALTGGLTSHRTYSFSLSCANTIGTTTATVYVIAINPNAPILTLSAYPTSIASGTASTLTWTLGGGVINTPTACTASGAWAGNKNPAGDTYDTGALTSSKTYTLACGNSYGTTTRSVGVSVQGQPSVQDVCVNGFWTLSPTTPCTSGGGTLGGAFGDILSLVMPDEDISPTVFYFYNDGATNALFMRQGPDGPDQIVRRLTAEGLHITDGSFEGLNCIPNSNQCSGVKIRIVLQKRGVDGSLQNFTIEKTFKTSANSRVVNN